VLLAVLALNGLRPGVGGTLRLWALPKTNRQRAESWVAM